MNTPETRRRFDRAVDKIYEAALQPSLWPDALQAIADCTNDVGAILIYGRDDGGFGVVESDTLKATAAEYIRDNWSFRDIRALRCRERGYFINGDVFTDRDILTPQEIATDPFYADLLKRHNLKYFAAATVLPHPHIEVGISVQRHIDRPEYTDDELDLVNRLGRHFERALRLGIRLLDSELINLGLGDALCRLGMGVFVLDGLGRVVFSNPAGQKLLGDGMDVLHDRLVINAPSRQLIGEGLSGLMDAKKPMLILRKATTRPLVVYGFPISPARWADGEFLSQARSIILVLDPDNNNPPDPAVVRDILGLTLGEARVAALVGSGLPPRAAAERLGIAEDTVRSSLKRVFSKVGVARQSELAALMTRLLLR